MLSELVFEAETIRINQHLNVESHGMMGPDMTPAGGKPKCGWKGILVRKIPEGAPTQARPNTPSSKSLSVKT